MKPLFTEEEYKESNSTQILLCECVHCKKPFGSAKKHITNFLKNPDKAKNTISFCSRKCKTDNQATSVNVKCSHCGNEFKKRVSQMARSKSGYHFCSRSCSATYNNKNKKHGTRRSKLEDWIEEQLTAMFPSLEIHFNQSEAIGSELDIYIPSLNVAFELNGIFHYEPIYGPDKLESIQENDQSKTKACHDAKIDLCVIDTSAQKYFKPKTSKKYLNIIVEILRARLSTS